MRIISDFKDYYDCVMRMGQADDLIYLRKKNEIKDGRFNILREYYSRYAGNLEINAFIVGFCGKIYGVIKLTTYYRGVEKKSTCFNIKQVDNFVDKWFKEKEAKDYRRKKRWCKNQIWNSLIQNYYVKWFKWIETNKDKYHQFFLCYNTPIFVAEYGKTTINACLKDVEFYRILDPYTTFQELQMWMSNQAQPRKPIPKVSDADMLIAKGFDKKTSFRRPPKKKKKK